MIGLLLSIPGQIKELLARLTSTRAGYLDRLDAAITTRAPSATALSTSNWTATRAGYLDNLNPAPASIKRILRGYITITNAKSGSYDLSATPVTTAKTELRALGASIDPPQTARVALTNSTTITATIYTTGSGTVGWELTEYN